MRWGRKCDMAILTALQVEKEKPPMNVVGDVHGKIAIVIVSIIHDIVHVCVQAHTSIV